MGFGNIIGWALFGLVAGGIARLLHPGRDPMNWVWTAILGVCGAMVGGWIGSQLGISTERGVSSWLAAVGGSILLLVIYHYATARSAVTSGPTTNDDYKRAVFKDLSHGPTA